MNYHRRKGNGQQARRGYHTTHNLSTNKRPTNHALTKHKHKANSKKSVHVHQVIKANNRRATCDQQENQQTTNRQQLARNAHQTNETTNKHQRTSETHEHHLQTPDKCKHHRNNKPRNKFSSNLTATTNKYTIVCQGHSKTPRPSSKSDDSHEDGDPCDAQHFARVKASAEHDKMTTVTKIANPTFRRPRDGRHF